MSNEKLFYDECTGIYFKSTKEAIDHAVEEANTMLGREIEQNGNVYVRDVMDYLYNALGINMHSKSWERVVYSKDYGVCGIMFKEVKDPEADKDISKEEDEMNKTRTDFEEFNVTINSDETSVILRFKRDGEDISFALYEDNIDTLRSWLKMAKQFIH